MVAAVALMALVSCNKEVTPSEENAPVGEIVTFEASVDGADTKTVLEGKVSKWSGEEWIQVVGSKAYWFGSEKMETPSDRAIFSYNGDNGVYDEDGWIYLKPNSNWTQAGARFAIYLCNGSKNAK